MKDADEALVGEALGALGGAVIVLDRGLNLRYASPAAALVMGMPLPTGASAPALLCGDRPKRPFAEALAAGRPIRATIPRPDGAPARVRVHSVPLGGGARPTGWVVHVAPAEDALDAGPEQFWSMWSQDPVMKHLFRVIEKVAQDDVPVLVRGETGAGKELVANALHLASPRRDGPFRAINCAALPANLLESELFGHARGAFTGAVKAMQGHVQLAHGGTLFLDEVAEVPLELQAKLLRVIETREVIPVGAREPIPVDVRFVSATHRALRAEVEAGRFRGDLMYRLRVIPLFLPPLRERRGDVALLVERFIAEMNPTRRRSLARVGPAALHALERYDWPGNVRELRNALAYAYAIGDGPSLELADLPPEIVDGAPEVEVSAAAEATAPDAAAPAEPPEIAKIRRALERSGGHHGRAAKLLGVSRVTLWRRMRGLSM